MSKINEKDAENLRYFFKETKIVFEDIIKSEEWFLDENMSELAKKSWRELRPRLEELEIAVMGSETSILGKAGLSGFQLEF